MIRNGLSRMFISTRELVKRNQELMKGNKTLLQQFKTYQSKVAFLNDPKTIQLIEMHEFGVKYKKGKILFVLGLALLIAFLHYAKAVLPINVSDMYFRISNHTPLLVQPNKHSAAYFFAPFNFQYPFYLYAPLLPVVYHISRFVSISKMMALIGINSLVCGVQGRCIVKRRLKEYEIWENQNICLGEGTYLFSLFCFLTTFYGREKGFAHPKLRIFLESIPGIGVVRRGIGIGSICLLYSCFQLYGWYFFEKKNSQLTGISILMGILSGLALKRWGKIKA